MSALQTLAALVVVLGILVFVHEAGHFMAAKWAGVWVHRFALGIGNPIPGLSFTRNGTEYAICWLPLGGYVKMATKEEEATSSALEGAVPDTVVPPEAYFESKPVWKRMIIILAGVTMNAIFAWMVFSGLAFKNGRAFDAETRIGAVDTAGLPPALAPLAALAPGDSVMAVNGTPVAQWSDIIDGIMSGASDTVTIAVAGRAPVVLAVHRDALEERAKAAQALRAWRSAVLSAVSPGGVAARAGLEVGDTILAADGTPTPQWDDFSVIVKAHAGDSVRLDVARGGERLALVVVPRADKVRGDDGKTRTVGLIGVGNTGRVVYERLSFLGSLDAGLSATIGASTDVVRMVRGMLTGRVSSRNVGGPIAIGQMAAASAQAGVDIFLGFLGLISINLAVLNLLPVPVLDGGQFLFLLAEGVLRRPLSLKLRERLTTVGLMLILALMVFAFSNDIRRMLGF